MPAARTGWRRRLPLAALGLLATLAVVILAAGNLAPATWYSASGRCYGFADSAGPTSRRTSVSTLCSALVDVGQAALGNRFASPPIAAAPVYPLQVSANGRYLIDQRAAPFLMAGDSPQGLIGNLSEADADVFFANRQRNGFNTVWVNLICNDYTGCNADGSAFDGLVPFTTPGDLSTPNEAYFARADRYIALAGRYGLNVVLVPIETGGWLKVLAANGADQAYRYGRYVGQRYVSFPNVVWMSGNDFQSWRNPLDDALVLAVARGIQDVDRIHLHTVELDYYVSASLDDPEWAPMVQLDAAYSYRPTYAEILNEYNRAPFRPVFMVEANYEWEHDYTGPQTLRRQAYWSLLSGATGQLYGNRYLWPFTPGWTTRLETLGTRQLQFVTNLFAPRRWYDLVPDQDHTLIAAGFGTFTDAGSVNDSDYVTAARTPDGTLAMAYLPTSRTITVDLTRFAKAVQARWYDPTSARFVDIPGSPFSVDGTRPFQSPGPNSEGAEDWVLVLEVK